MLCYYTKFVLFALLSAFEALIFSPLMLFSPRNSKNCILPCWASRLSSKLILDVEFEIRGLEYLPTDKGCVIVINHQSALDTLVLAYLWPHVNKGFCIVKKSVLYLIPFGPIAWLWGTEYIDRLNSDKSKNVINKMGQKVIQNKSTLCVFPEGTRNTTDTLLPFKKGAFHVAIAAKCPIIPVVVSKYHFLDHKMKIFNGGKPIIQFLPPISSENKSIDELIKITRNEMQNAFNKLSQETMQYTKLKSHL